MAGAARTPDTRVNAGPSTQSDLPSRVPGTNRGQVILMVAIMATVLLGMVAMVTDTAMIWLNRRALQNAVDAAALAGAQQLPDDTADAESVACTYATEKNGVDAMSGKTGDCDGQADVAISTTYVADDTLTVTAYKQVQPLIGHLVGWEGMEVSADATAVIGSLTTACPFPIFQTPENLPSVTDVAVPACAGPSTLTATVTVTNPTDGATITFGLFANLRFGGGGFQDTGERDTIDLAVGQTTYPVEFNVSAYQDLLPGGQTEYNSLRVDALGGTGGTFDNSVNNEKSDSIPPCGGTAATTTTPEPTTTTTTTAEPTTTSTTTLEPTTTTLTTQGPATEEPTATTTTTVPPASPTMQAPTGTTATTSAPTGLPSTGVGPATGGGPNPGPALALLGGAAVLGRAALRRLRGAEAGPDSETG